MRAVGGLSDPYQIITPSGFPPPWDTTPATQVSPYVLRGWKVLTIVLVGQSNSANMSLGYQYTVTNTGNVLLLNVYDGALYQYTEPAIGASGNGGHWIGEAADILVTNGLYNYVVIVPAAAIGAASIEMFARGYWGVDNYVGGSLFHRIITCANRVRDLGLNISCFNFALGESAVGYPQASFQLPLQAMVDQTRSAGFNAPWIMDITTYHNDIINEGAVAALTDICNNTDILPGVNTDDLTYGDGYRILEGEYWVHLNEAGCHEKAARKAANITTWKDYLPLGL
jgi:hypothetical protein